MSIKFIRFSKYIFLVLMCVSCSLHSWYFRYRPSAPVIKNQTEESVRAPLVTVLLAPGGDIHNQGRSLEHQFEYTSTMACAQSLKNTIETLYPDVRVLISHKVGEIVQPFQVATMSNTMDVDLVISLHCYHEAGAKPVISLYHYSNGADFVSKVSYVSWYTTDAAYLFSKDTTLSWAKMFTHELATPAYSTLFNVAGPYKVPFRPLSGIKVPAMGIEMSLKQDEDWATYVEPIAHACKPLFGILVHAKIHMEGV